MSREQAKIRCKLSKEEWKALGESGFVKWYEVMQHFANGGDVEYESMGVWVIAESPMFGYAAKYRIKTKTHIVNGFEVPAPIEKYTGQTVVYVPSFCITSWAAAMYTTAPKEMAIKRGAAFETPEAARANALAMVGIDPSAYKE